LKDGYPTNSKGCKISGCLPGENKFCLNECQ
nr:RecName: Full=Babycurus-toxin 1; Short=BcTx1 [Babycurus centrurimorphus]